tara:strand:+ start:504 stop:818 length:315 start_codon:yes stop_codon:yes gene_type:complete
MNSRIDGYSISRDDLVESYVRKHYDFGTVIVMFNVQNHLDYLKEKGFSIHNTYVWDNEIMIFEFRDVEEAKFILDYVSGSECPFTQIWSHGKLICDNIDRLTAS